MSKNFVYSTLTCSNTYTSYRKTENELPEVESRIVIHGGSNVATKHLVTPRGVVTEVSDEQLAILLDNELFQRHMKNGFIAVETVKVDPEQVAADMVTRDEGAPLTPNDYDPEADGPHPSERNMGNGESKSGKSTFLQNLVNKVTKEPDQKAG